MMKRFSVLLALLFFGVAFVEPAFAATEEGRVRIEVFERLDCSHCIAEKEFLTGLQAQRQDLEIVYRDIADLDQRRVFNQLAEIEGLTKATPITLIGSTVIQGFGTAETTGSRFLKLIAENRGKTQLTFEKFIEAGGSQNIESAGPTTCDASGAGCAVDEPFLVNVPFFGPVDVMKYSLPTLSAILGFVDGFNPCAMWVLVMLLTLLIEAGSKRRMWQMAGLFILAETIMYYFILNVWMTTWDFIGMNRIVTPIVGLVSVGAGGFFLYEFKKNDGTCKVTDAGSRKKTLDKMKHYVTAPMTLLTALGILGLAFSVNILEFACSIGIPQAFTKILDLNIASWIGRQFYMFLYILFYMFDDFVVFGLALWSFDRIGLTTHKYTRASHLIGGVLMLILGALFLFKPEWLVFN